MLLANFAQINRNCWSGMNVAFSNPHSFLKAVNLNNFYLGDHVVAGETEKSSWNNGYSGSGAWWPAMKAGGLGAVHTCRSAFSAVASGALGVNIEGSTAITFALPGAQLDLVVNASGTTTITMSASASLVGAQYAQGTAPITFTVSNALLGAVINAMGTAPISFAGSATPRALGWIEGYITPYTELSPENLASAVWNSVLANYPDAGTAGNAMALASSGGVDYNALAEAVWEYATRTLTAGGGAPTVEEIRQEMDDNSEALVAILKFAKLAFQIGAAK